MPRDLFEKSGIDLLEKKEEEPGLLESLGKGYLNYYGGALRGMGQSLGDVGASALNLPISGLEHLTGHKLPHVPHPHLINAHPTSLSESLGQNIGQLGAGLGLPGGLGFKGAQLANRGYQALRAGKKLPLIGKLLGAGAGGALEGYAGNEENRPLGATLGAITGTAGYAAPAAINFAKSMKSSNIAKEIRNEMEHLGAGFNRRFGEHLQAGEEAGANKFLRGEKANVGLLKKAGESRLAHGLEKFNANPTLANAHNAQSDLNKIVSKYAKSQEGTLDADVYKEALKLKNRLLQKISEAFEKSGAKEHGLGYQKARVDYATQMGPYLSSKSISNLLGKNKRGIQTLRPSEFADKLLKEEEFLSQAGHRHPGLLRREKTKKALGNPIVQKGIGGAALMGGAYLPYEIAKLLGLK
jgi:hypothetical protein